MSHETHKKRTGNSNRLGKELKGGARWTASRRPNLNCAPEQGAARHIHRVGFFKKLDDDNAMRAALNRRALAAIVGGIVIGTLTGAFSQSRPTDGGTDSELRLPSSLQASIRANFSSYRVPENKDLKAAWVRDRKLGSSPFLCLGDFNGDGIEDTALILIGERTWRLVIFEQDKQGEYRPTFIARPKSKQELGKYWENEILLNPQQMLVRKVPRGATWAPEVGDVPHPERLKVDAIELTVEPAPNVPFASLLVQEKDKYRQLFGDPLVELPVNAQ